MLIEPVDDRTARAVLPQRSDASRGLFAWGRDQLKSARLVIAWLEFAFVFLFLPGAAVFAGMSSATPIVIMIMLSSTVAFLSMTRSFHWRDLLPVDPLSEWRLVVAFSLAFAAIAAGATLAFQPERFLAPDAGVAPMLIAFPFLTALPIELVYRALFLRRFGHLFMSEWGAVLVGACANGLAYFILSPSISGAVFGFVLGVSLGWFYLRTGQFALCVLLHWIAAISVWVIGPGLGLY